MSTAEFESFRTDTRQHNATVGRAATITREIQALAALSWEPTRFAAVTVPTLHIAGELTVGPAYPTHQDISAAFPDASHVTIPGQAHVAFAYDPDGFADIVLEFTAGVRLSG